MQPWLMPIVLSALALGVYDICRKHAVRDNSVLEVLLFSTSAGAVTFIVLALVSGELPEIVRCTMHQYFLLLGKALLVGLSWVCVYTAMRKMPISIASPIRATSPFWTVIGGLLIYHEVPTALCALGMMLVLAGYCRFSDIGKLEGFTLRHRDMHLILLGTLLGSASALYDKYLLNILGIPPKTVQFYFSVNLVVLYSSAWVLARMAGVRSSGYVWRWSIPFAGILLIVSDFLYFYAVSVPDVHISVLSLFRRCSCVITFVVGAYIFRDVNMRRKTVALLLILAGAIIIALS